MYIHEYIYLGQIKKGTNAFIALNFSFIWPPVWWHLYLYTELVQVYNWVLCVAPGGEGRVHCEDLSCLDVSGPPSLPSVGLLFQQGIRLQAGCRLCRLGSGSTHSTESCLFLWKYLSVIGLLCFLIAPILPARPQGICGCSAHELCQLWTFSSLATTITWQSDVCRS